jgi:hypothetical protein
MDCQNHILWHLLRMRTFLAVALMMVVLLPVARAQQEADEKYIVIYSLIQQADTGADTGEPRAALGVYVEAQAQLLKFQKLFPNWNPDIVNYRKNDLAQKIAGLKLRVPALKNAAQFRQIIGAGGRHAGAVAGCSG